MVSRGPNLRMLVAPSPVTAGSLLHFHWGPSWTLVFDHGLSPDRAASSQLGRAAMLYMF